MSASHVSMTRLQGDWQVLNSLADDIARGHDVPSSSYAIRSAAARHWRLRHFNVGSLPWSGLSHESDSHTEPLRCWIHIVPQLTVRATNDYLNSAEATYIIDLLYYLIAGVGCFGRIGVIAPYGAQIEEIHRQVSANRILTSRLTKALFIGNKNALPLSDCRIVVLSTVVDGFHALTDHRWLDCLATVLRLKQPGARLIIVGDCRLNDYCRLSDPTRNLAGPILFPPQEDDSPWLLSEVLLEPLLQKQRRRLYVAVVQEGLSLLPDAKIAGKIADFIAIKGERRLAIVIDRKPIHQDLVDRIWPIESGWTVLRFSPTICHPASKRFVGGATVTATNR